MVRKSGIGPLPTGWSLVGRLVGAITVSLGALCAATAPQAADWARWLGPDQNGRSPEKNVFGKAAPRLEVAWQRDLGRGYSAIAVAEGRVLTMHSDGETDWLVALKAADGKPVWRQRVHATLPAVGASDGGPLSMPVVDDGMVYALGAAGRLMAVGLADGVEAWSRDLADAMEAPRPYFGFTTTPLVVDEKLIVQVGASVGRSLVAFDKKSGKTLWQVGGEPVGYQSPIVTSLGGKEQIVAVTDVSVQGVRASDGRTLWRVEHGIGDSVAWATPVLIGDDAFALVGRKAIVAFRIGRGEDGPQVRELWRGEALRRNFANPIFHDGHLYGYDGGALACVDARNGKQVWKQSIEAVGLILVDGHLVLLDSNGELRVAPATPRGFAPKVSKQVAASGSQTSPSFSDGAFYVRNLERIVRIDVRAP